MAQRSVGLGEGGRIPEQRPVGFLLSAGIVPQDGTGGLVVKMAVVFVQTADLQPVAEAVPLLGEGDDGVEGQGGGFHPLSRPVPRQAPQHKAVAGHRLVEGQRDVIGKLQKAAHTTNSPSTQRSSSGLGTSASSMA